MPGNFHTPTIEEIEHWPKANFINPEARTWLPGFAIFWTVLGTVLVGGRLYLRMAKRSGGWGWDDSCLFCAWVFSIIFTATACISVWDFDTGRHVWDVRPDRYQGALYWGWICQVMFLWSSGFTKMSVLLFYRRIVKDTYNKIWIYTVWVLMFITASSVIAIFFAYCFMCTPLSSYWNIQQMISDPDSLQCLDGDAITIAVGVITIASDFWTAALPCAMFQVHDLGVSKRQKIALNVIFCLGFIVTGVGIARTYYLWVMGHSDDLSWIGYDLFVTSIVEIHLAIICTCAPFCRAFVRTYFPDLANRSRNNTSNSSNNNTANRKSFAPSTVAPSTVRSSYQPPVFKHEGKSGELNLEAQEEKTGFLVREESSGRLVWSGRAHRMSQFLSSEPVECT